MTLIEKLEQQRDRYFKYHTDYGHRDFEMRGWGVEKAIEIIEEHSDWVSVNERLPTHTDTYPAIADGRFGIARFDAEYKAWLFKNFEVYELMANVTHWQEKPQPPSEVQGDYTTDTGWGFNES